MTDTVTSADGTTIAYDRGGEGPTLIVIGGAFNTRQSPGDLVPLLAPHLRVITYDRRGRVDSGDADAEGGAPLYAVEREIEDLAALIDAVGDDVFAYGHSSGAILGLEAASRGLPINRLVAYEPPYTADPDAPAALTGDGVVPAARFGSITAQTLIMDGAMSPAWAARAAEAVVAAVPGARRLTVAGQNHNVDPAVLAPFLLDFFG